MKSEYADKIVYKQNTMNTYTQHLSRPTPKSLIHKSFKDMTRNEFTALKKYAMGQDEHFTKKLKFSRAEFLQDISYMDKVMLKRKKTDQKNIHLNYLKSNEEIKINIAKQLKDEKESRMNSEIVLPEYLQWEKLMKTKLFYKPI